MSRPLLWQPLNLGCWFFQIWLFRCWKSTRNWLKDKRPLGEGPKNFSEPSTQRHHATFSSECRKAVALKLLKEQKCVGGRSGRKRCGYFAVCGIVESCNEIYILHWGKIFHNRLFSLHPLFVTSLGEEKKPHCTDCILSRYCLDQMAICSPISWEMGNMGPA